MRQIVGIILGCALLIAAPNAGDAQSLRKVTTPAENPPSSFTGSQYVDSRGCVFIRAGFGGKVTWVPRVNRSRKVYCNKQNKPSLSNSQLAALGQKPVIVDTPAPAAVQKQPKRRLFTKRPVTTVAETPVRTVVRKPVKPAVVQPVVKPRVAPKTIVRRVMTAPKRVVVPTQTRVVRQAVPAVPQVPVVRRVVVQPQAVVRRAGSGQIHPGDYVRARNGQGAAIVTQPSQVIVPGYTQGTGSQQIHPGDYVRSRRLRAGAAANASVFAPRQKAPRVVTRAYTTDNVYGLTTVGTIITPDVTPRGDAQTDLIWTKTVPRRLIKRKVRVRQVRVASAQGL